MFFTPNINADQATADKMFISLELQDYSISDYLSNRKEIYDPLEKLNRKIFVFNGFVNKIIIIPIAKIYNFAIPEYIRDRVESFTNNLNTPAYMINNLLQRDVNAGFTSFWRFTINTTFGICGLFDIATIVGLKNKSTDFGRTLAKYNIGFGPYLVLPILGSSSMRDLTGSIVDYSVDPFNHKIYNYKFTAKEKFIRSSLYYTDLYAKYIEAIEDAENNSLDPYITFRSLYIQIREAK
jgi:phospholipid-binding lipoprotein MlaA